MKRNLNIVQIKHIARSNGNQFRVHKYSYNHTALRKLLRRFKNDNPGAVTMVHQNPHMVYTFAKEVTK